MLFEASLLAAGFLLHFASGKVLVLNDTHFDALTTDGDFFVDIYAPWCAHCKQLEPIWERLAQKLEGQVQVAKIDATQNPVLLNRFYVQKFPTLVFLSNGEARTFDGARGERQLSQFALEDWRQTKPWPFYMAPNSKFGRTVGFILGLPVRLKQVYRFLHDTLRLPQLAVIVVFLSFPVLIGLAFICFLDFWHNSRVSQPPARLHGD